MLRAEKGRAMIGDETDGTVTPQDLGLGWAVTRQKPDFIGKRAQAREDLTRPGRKEVVGLLTEDPDRGRAGDRAPHVRRRPRHGGRAGAYAGFSRQLRPGRIASRPGRPSCGASDSVA